jgi:thioredoxin 1
MTPNDSSGTPAVVTDETFKSFVDVNGIVVVDFWASWCFPCQVMGQVIESLAAEHRNVSFGKLNVDENRKVTDHYGIMTIPTLLYFRNGELVDRSVGALAKEAVEKRIKQLFI